MTSELKACYLSSDHPQNCVNCTNQIICKAAFEAGQRHTDEKEATLRYEAEEYQCLSMVLDDLGVAKAIGVNTLSLVGRFNSHVATLKTHLDNYIEIEKQLGIYKPEGATLSDFKGATTDEKVQRVVEAAKGVVCEDKVCEDSGCSRFELCQAVKDLKGEQK